ncbi:ubiquitin-protein ligase [Lithospermum erythrorhizon]|uniref:HECT-type E3 ubiquitin transferase n=1 Tax=Lithospermum erythrorhizon TaxID=34254 RepID=A0AAV3QC41_LITER
MNLKLNLVERSLTKVEPPKIRSFIHSVTTAPLESIEEPLRSFTWQFDKGDFHHWVDLFNHFDTYFDKYIKPRKDLQLEDNFLECDPPFPKEAVIQILRVIRIILDNCSNKHFYSSYEHHLSLLLASTYADLVEACLQTLAAFMKKTIGKCVIRDASLRSKLSAFAQGWGSKEEGLGLIACSMQNGFDPHAYDLGSTLHFEFYAVDEYSSGDTGTEPPGHGLKVIHLPDINSIQESDLELLSKLTAENAVPLKLRFSLLARLRFARSFSSLAVRHQYICIRLYAFIVLVQACGDSDDLCNFFNMEPEFINELVNLLSHEDEVPEKIRILSMQALVALCHDRSRQPSVLTAVTSGGHHGILSSLTQKAVDAVINNSSKSSILFAEALLSLITVLVSSSSGCSAMREAGFIPTLLPLLKDTNVQHLHLVSTAVHVLEAFMDYSNPAAALFRDLGGLDDAISRLEVEVSHTETVALQPSVDMDTSDCCSSHGVFGTPELENMQSLYNEALVAYHRRLLLKSLLCAISLGTYAPGTATRIYGSEESLLPHSLCTIFRRANDFGGGVFALAATVMSDLIHKDPTCFAVLEGAGLPSAFIGAITDGVLCSAEAITCIPQCLDALCLNSRGLQLVKDHKALRCFVNIFTSRTYLEALAGDTPASLSSGLDELMRHSPSLRESGVDMLIEILNNIGKPGSGHESSPSSTDIASCSADVPMETNCKGGTSVSAGYTDSCEGGSSNQPPESAIDASADVNASCPEFINNTARLLETILQNSDMCRLFVEKKGIEAVLQLFNLPHMPLTVSLGQSISLAFKNFSQQHSTALAREVCIFFKEYVKLANEQLGLLGGVQLVDFEVSKRTEILRSLWSLEGIMALSNTLLKGTTSIVSELGAGDADVLKDLGRAYKEILWLVSLYCDSKVEKQSNEVDRENTDADISHSSRREIDDDSSVTSLRYLNPVSVRNGSHPWSVEREFLTALRSSDGFSRRSRHGLPRIRGGRTGRHLEALQIDSELGASMPETSSLDLKKKSPHVLVSESIDKVACTMRSFFIALVKGFSSLNRRRIDSGSLNAVSKSVGSALAKVFLDALGFSGYPNSSSIDIPLSVKCRYLGKVVDDMVALTFDSRRRSCYTSMVNNFYVHGTFKELLTTFEATSQLLWTLPCSVPASCSDLVKSSSEGRFAPSSWLLETLNGYCRLLDYFANPSVLLSPNSSSQAQLLVQPVAVGLSIGLFPVPRDPEVFVRMLQSQVLDVILPIWNHPMLPQCNLGFITSIISLLTHIYCGVGDSKQKRSTLSGNASQHLARHPPPDEDTIATIVDMGFPRARAEEALRRVETNSVELAMEWLFNHNEDHVEGDDELAHALALSLGSSSESSKSDGCEKSTEFLQEECQTKAPPVDEILSSVMKFQGNDSLAYPLADLFVTLCNRNKREDRAKIIPYFVEQLKLCPLELNDSSPLSMLSHTLVLLLSEDGNTRGIAASSGIGFVAIDILVNLKDRAVHGCVQVVSKCISALLLILDNLLQSRPKLSTDGVDGTLEGSLPYSAEEQASSLLAESLAEKHADQPRQEKDSDIIFENIFGKATGYLTKKESLEVLLISCDLMKQHAPAMVMQAVLQLCARLTKTYSLAVEFLENGGLVDLLGLPRGCFFPGYDTLASAIVRHLLEDPQTLQTAMELEIRQTLSGSRYAGRVSVRTFLTSISSVISRDPGIFMKASAAVCHLETSGGRSFVVLLKEKEREKIKASGVEQGISISEGARSESRAQDGLVKCSKGYKRFPVNLTRVIDHLLGILLSCPFSGGEGNNMGYSSYMDVDDATTKMKGKTKVGEALKSGPDSSLDRSAVLPRVTFVLKLLSDILLMYVQAVSVILRRDIEIFQHRGPNQSDYSESGGIIHHILHHLLPLPADKSAGPDDWREKLSEKASWFLVVLSGRSVEGRRRVISELVKAVSSFSKSEGHSPIGNLLPDKKVLAYVDLVYAILSKNSSSSSIPCSGCSPDIAKSMIEGGVVQCLSSILQVVDLDYPEASKVVNLVLKSLEILTRAANEQALKSDSGNKKRSVGLNETSDSDVIMVSTSHVSVSGIPENSGQLTNDPAGPGQQLAEASPNVDDHNATSHYPVEPEMRIEEAAISANPPVDYPGEEMVEDGLLHSTGQPQMTFPVENRVDDMGDDVDMGDDGEDDEDDDEPDEEDEDIAEDGNGLMSLVDTEDLEDHDDGGLGDEYNDDMMDEDDDEFHENRVIEVRWREALDGLDQFQVHGQFGTGGGLIDVAAEPFEGVNVDDLFGMSGSFGFERRRQTSRASLERSTNEGIGLRHPLLSRPSHHDDTVALLNSVRESEPLSARNIDLAHLYMLDAPVLPYDNSSGGLFSNRLPAAQSLGDFSVGLESLQASARRGAGDGRWTDDGQPQAGGLATAVARAIEEQFITHLSSNVPPDRSAETQSQNNNLVDRQQAERPLGDHTQLGVDGNDSGSQHNDDSNQNGDTSRHQTSEGEFNLQAADREASAFPSSGDTSLNQIREGSPNNDHDILEVGDEKENESDPSEIPPNLLVTSTSLQVLQGGMQCLTSSDPDASFEDVGVAPLATQNGIGEISDPGVQHVVSVQGVADIDMNGAEPERDQADPPSPEINIEEPSLSPNVLTSEDVNLTEEIAPNAEPPTVNAIDPTFLEALPEDLRAEVLASQRPQSVPTPSYTPPRAEDIDPEFLAALPPDIQAEVLAQQRAQRIVQQTEGQPVDMDNASIIATFPAELREEVLLTSSEAVLSALPSPLLAEAQMLRDRAMSHYQARSLFGSRHRLNNRRNGLGLERQNVMDRGVGVSNGHRSSSLTETLRLKELEGEPLLDANALRGLIRLLRLSEPLGKGLLQRLLLNLCTHGHTRTILVYLLLDTMKPDTEGHGGGSVAINSQRLYGCHSNVVHTPSRLSNGLPPIVLRRVLEILTYLATNHSAVANILFYFDPSLIPECSRLYLLENKNAKGKEKIIEGQDLSLPDWNSPKHDIPLILFLKLLNEPLFLSSAHLEQVMGLLQVVVFTATSKLDCRPHSVDIATISDTDQIESQGEVEKKQYLESNKDGKAVPMSHSHGSMSSYDIIGLLPKSDLHNLCRLLGHEGLSEKVYMLAGEVLKKLASVAAPLRKLFISDLSDLAHNLGSSAVEELITLRKTNMLGLSAGSMAGAAVLRVLQTLSSFALICCDATNEVDDKEDEERAIMWKLNVSLEPLWQELSKCIGTMETGLIPSSSSPSITTVDQVQGSSSAAPSLPPGTQRLLPFIEAFFVLCEKLQANNSVLQHDSANVTATEVKESVGSSELSVPKWSPDILRKVDWSVTFIRFAEKHRRLLNAFVRQNPSLLEKSLSVMLKTPRLIDFDNKKAYFRSRIRQQNEHLSAPLRVSVRRAYVLEDSYNQLRMRPNQDLRGRLNVHFQGEEGIDAGGLTREWYQLLSRVIFDKGALLFTTVGNNATFQPNPNSVYQTEHLSYFKFVGRVVAKALFDGQLLDVYFTRSFYKHILGVKVTYHDIEAVDPDYYKNLKWMLENDVNDILDLTFSMDADEEKHILYEKTEVTDYELKPGGRNLRVTEETKYEYVDLVADHILTNAIRPQINSFLEGFNELVPRELISIFNDKELELLISGLPEINLDDLVANTEYTGYTAASSAVQWFWEVVRGFSKEDMARLLQFSTGTSKVPLEGFKALQGISGPQRFQIHKAYGAPERLPSAHTCFNQLDLPEYTTKDQLQERLLLAIHEASEGFGFG